MKHSCRVLGLIVFWFGAAVGHASAQDLQYPKAPVKVVVGYPAGNTTDFIARTIGERLAAKWQQPVVIENLPGAGSSLAAAMTAKARNDGYTMLFTANAAMTIAPHLYESVAYDALKDFDYVNLVVWVPYVCAVTLGLPIHDVASLVQYTKASPDKLAYGSPGSGTMSHLTMERLKAEHGVNVLHVPYKGSGAVVADLVAGHIQIACEPANIMMPLAKAGRIRVIGVTSEKRLSILPNIPTIGETLTGFTSGAWIGVVMPRDTPRVIVNKVSEDISEVLRQPEMRAKLEGVGLVVLSEGPAAFARLAQADYERSGKLVRQLNLKP